MPAPLSSPPQVNVLAVDDCPATRELMRASLEFFGYRVQAVDSGWAALDAAGQEAFDAIILDVEMPGMDGMSVGRALRQDPKHASTVIAMHTSVAEDQVRAGFSQYDAFLPKSASPLALGERVHGLLSRRRGDYIPA